MSLYDVVVFDTETDGFNYTKVHCAAIVAYKSFDDREGDRVFVTSEKELEAWALRHTHSQTLWVAHNACGFDWWVVNDLTNLGVRQDQAVDTSVLTKLKDYTKFNTHSLEEIGEYLGCPKSEYNGGWDTYTPEMGEYCKQDTEVLAKIWLKYRNVLKEFPDAVKVEHEVSFICAQMQRDGFKFNTQAAEELLESVESEMAELEANMQKEWPPTLVEDRRIQYRETKDGVPYATVIKAQANAPKWKREGNELILYKYKEFNPGSSKDRVEKLWDAGWKPFDRTKGHVQYVNQNKRAYRRNTGG